VSAADWYLTIFCLATGAGIPLYWVTPAGRRATREPGREIRFHVLAEIATGFALIVAGAGILADAGWATKVCALALGMLVYTLLGSPGRYLDRGDRRTVMLLAVTWLGAIPAVVLTLRR
jgi:hypothetical protein